MIKGTKISLDYARSVGYIKEEETLNNGFIHRGHIIKCPYCKHEVDKVNTSFEECWGSMVASEFDYKCSYCKEVLGHYHYGNYEYDFIDERGE